MTRRAASSNHVARRETDHVRARKFAVKWATSDSDGEIANLARAYLNARHEAESPRCRSIGPAPDRFRCVLQDGHDGPHTALSETGAWVSGSSTGER
jgi:hypothetical protein